MILDSDPLNKVLVSNLCELQNVIERENFTNQLSFWIKICYRQNHGYSTLMSWL